MRFWEDKPLENLTPAEWESLCDGCGLCCLHKLQDATTNKIFYTRVVCRYMDLTTGSCSDYANRSINVPTCAPLNLQAVAEFDWLPETCSYRLRYFNKQLPSWHPLNNAAGLAEPSQDEVKYGLKSIAVVVENSSLDLEDYLIDKP